MRFDRIMAAIAAASLAMGGSALGHAQDNTNQPPEHSAPFPNLSIGKNREEIRKGFEQSPHLERGIPAKEMLEQQRRLNSALARLKPHTPGAIDAYVISVALDSDPVFAREAREAGRVLENRYGASGRVLTLAGPDGERDDLPAGSIRTLLLGLAHIAEIMDPDEDVLVLYTTSHGSRAGLVNHYGDTSYGIFSPIRLKKEFDALGIKRRMLIISACYSGVFTKPLASPDTAILTAAAAERTSFGCQPENDWTFYGDALINNALRKPQSLSQAAQEANRMIAAWETKRRLLASLPQISVGANAGEWLDVLEARMPQVASAPVGRSAAAE